MKKRIVVLGAGISGLTCAWQLKKQFGDSIDLKVIEKQSRVGGWIKSEQNDGYFFEGGPRSCRPAIHTLSLIEELGLQDEVIVANSRAQIRYLNYQGSLRQIPTNFFGFFLSPLTRTLPYTLFKEFFVEKGSEDDETIEQFFLRRLKGSAIVETLIDAMVTGIYAGDIKKLSMKACFPKIYQMEREQGSLIKGFWSRSKKNVPEMSEFINKMTKTPLFSFKNGMETLPLALANQLQKSLLLGCEVIKFEFQGDKVMIYLSNQEQIEADYLISALPLHQLGHLLTPISEQFAFLSSFPCSSLVMVNVGFNGEVLPKQGFGYLTPSKENNPILGSVWDSSIFPEHNFGRNQTRLTMMLGGAHHPYVLDWTERQCQEVVLRELRDCLGIHFTPDKVAIKVTKVAIPQYEIGYQEKMKQFRESLKSFTSCFSTIGNGFDGVSINECILNSSRIIADIDIKLN